MPVLKKMSFLGRRIREKFCSFEWSLYILFLLWKWDIKSQNIGKMRKGIFKWRGEKKDEVTSMMKDRIVQKSKAERL